MSPPSWTSHDFGDSLSKPSIYKGRVDSEIVLPTRTARPQSKTKIRGVTLHVRGIQSREEHPNRKVRRRVRDRESIHQRNFGHPFSTKREFKENQRILESTSLAFKIQFHLETEKIGVILRSKPGHQTFSALYPTDNRCTTSSRATKSCIDANPKSARPPTSGAAMMASSS